MSDMNVNEAMPEIALLKFLTTRENYNKYITYIKEFNLEQETETVLNSITDYYKEFPEKDEITISELIIYNSLRNPLIKKRELYSELFQKLEKLNVDSALIKENFNNLLEKYYSSEILFKLSSAIENDERDALKEAKSVIEEFESAKLRLVDKESKFVTNDIEQIILEQEEKPGFKWRLPSLNEHLGDITGKTLGHIFARVDTGKTSFVFSEESHWVKQMRDDECLIHFNNEEDGKKLMKRFYQAFLNIDKDTLAKFPDKCKKEFYAKGGHRFHLYDDAIISIEDIEEELKTHKARIIVVDQADKLVFTGHTKLGDVARLQMVYAKLRELSKKYDVHILTVGQASQSAENKKWLLPTDLDSSKTLKPGEFDYIIGIGKLFGDSISGAVDIRYMHLCKNKLGTGNHAQFEAIIDTSRALYREPTYQELEVAYGNMPKDTSPDRLAYMAA